jgi:UDP-GlcNAc:undecaprenyl-phosphate/decaprenyl-phosphate GlcNAc-1-phosphate transferase
MLLYILSIFAFGILLTGYFRLADHFNIIDKPNERSSHKHITIRGGGIVFPVAAIFWFLVYGFNHPWIIFALLLLATVSFLDDVVSLSSKLRIVVHFIAVSLLFWQLQLFDLPWYGVAVVYLLVIAWINAFNFMDGINGMTAFYGLATLLTFAWLNHAVEFVSQHLIILLMLSVLVFSFFNARKRAITFAGDIGSVSMAFLLAWFMISLILKTGRLEYILFFSVYGIDSATTILFRLLQRENIFEAHRTHLYQYLGNELNWPHVLVSGIYGTIQAGINILVVTLISNDKMNWQLFIMILVLLTAFYLIIRLKIIRILQHNLI